MLNFNNISAWPKHDQIEAGKRVRPYLVMRWFKVIFYAPKLLAVWGRENHKCHIRLIPGCQVVKSSRCSSFHFTAPRESPTRDSK